MLSIHFTLPQVVNMLRIIAQNDPDRLGTVGGCIYASSDVGGNLTPVCIVGQMFSNLGLLRLLMEEPSNLGSQYANGDTCGVGSGLWDSLARFGVTADEDAKTFMRTVQYRQDNGTPWGQAFAESVDEYLSEQNEVLDHEQAVIDRKRSDLAHIFG